MITHVYTLNTTNQLVDINDTFASFTTMYSITADDINDEFDYAIASQSMLDSKKAGFKKAIGYIEDSFTQSGKPFENWYLILRANKDTPCKVSLEITSLDPPPTAPPSPVPTGSPGRTQLNTESGPSGPSGRRPPPPQRQRRPPPPPRQKTPPPSQLSSYLDSSDSESEDEKVVEKYSKPEKESSWWWYLLVGFFIIGLTLFLLWWFGKLHYLPFYNFFVKYTPTQPQPTHSSHSSSSSSKPQVKEVVIEKVVEVPVFNPLPPPPPPPPTPVAVVAPVAVETPSIVSETIATGPSVLPVPHQLDSNFINEMRELKINF